MIRSFRACSPPPRACSTRYRKSVQLRSLPANAWEWRTRSSSSETRLTALAKSGVAGIATGRPRERSSAGSPVPVASPLEENRIRLTVYWQASRRTCVLSDTERLVREPVKRGCTHRVWHRIGTHWFWPRGKAVFLVSLAGTHSLPIRAAKPDLQIRELLHEKSTYDLYSVGAVAADSRFRLFAIGQRNAKIVLTEVATGVNRSGQSNESGNYTYPNLPPGQYSVTVEAAGFKKETRKDIVVQINTRSEEHTSELQS